MGFAVFRLRSGHILSLTFHHSAKKKRFVFLLRLCSSRDFPQKASWGMCYLFLACVPDFLFLPRLTRRTPREQPLSRGSRFYCRNSLRENKCRKRWQNFSGKGKMALLLEITANSFSLGSSSDYQKWFIFLVNHFSRPESPCTNIYDFCLLT